MHVLKANLHTFLMLATTVCICGVQGSVEPVYQTDFSGALDTGANAPIDGGGDVQTGFSASHYSAGAGLIRMRVVPRGQEFPPKSDPSSWGEAAFISEAAGTNPAMTIEEAVEADAYIEFSLQSTEPANFTRIEFSMVGTGSNKSGAIVLRASADQFSSNLGAAEGALDNKDYPTSVDLKGLPGFDDVREVTFRFYLYDSFEGNNNRLIGIDRVQVWAEPATTSGVP